MGLPITFGALTGPIPLSDLDENFAAVGALTVIPCVIVGTSTVTMTPLADTPAITAYENYLLFSGIPNQTNTGALFAAVPGLAGLQIYKDTTSGPEVLTGGEVTANNAVILMYDSALNSGAGGFHLIVSAHLLTTGTGVAVLANTPVLITPRTTGYTVATLPAASTGLRGARAHVTDASVSSASVGAAITGAGANIMPVFCNGSAWVYG